MGTVSTAALAGKPVRAVFRPVLYVHYGLSHESYREIANFKYGIRRWPTFGRTKCGPPQRAGWLEPVLKLPSAATRRDLRPDGI
jgi:hypothetical protein